jgi:hypothetical protein
VKQNEKERDAAWFASAALHIVLGLAILWVLSLPMPLEQWLVQHHVGPQQESIRYIATAQQTTAAPHAGGNGRTQKGPVPPPAKLVAPITIPVGVPDTKPGAKPVPEAATGPVISAGGAGPGIMPMLTDARIWLPPGAVNVAPLSDSARFDSAFHESVQHLQDLAKKQAGAINGVFSAGGKKYGLDSNNIYIADYKIPAALLALLPIHPSGPASQEYTTSGRQIADVNYQAGRALDAEDFKTAVKRIRQRKEREKRDKEIAAGKTPTTAVDAPVETPVHKKPMVDPIALTPPE